MGLGRCRWDGVAGERRAGVYAVVVLGDEPEGMMGRLAARRWIACDGFRLRGRLSHGAVEQPTTIADGGDSR